MGTYFYLSFARVEADRQVARFFHDLSDSIRFCLNLQMHQSVGFFDANIPQQTGEWTANATEALKTSRVLVALLSPAYMRDERAGKEWQIFFDRIRLSEEQYRSPQSPTIDFKRVIVPVTWLPWHSQTSHVVSGTPVFYGDPYRVTQQRPIFEMLRSLRDCARDYSQFIKDLADHIVRISERVSLTPLEVVRPFKECQNCFDLPDEPTGPHIDEAESDKQSLFVVEAVISKVTADKRGGIKERMRPMGYQETQASHLHIKIDHSNHEETIPERQDVMEKLNVWVIDDEEQVLNVIRETATLSGLFEVQCFKDANRALSKLELRKLHYPEPDLFVVDLELQAGEMQGLQLIEQLSAKKIKSSILAVSGNLGAEELFQAVGVGATAAVAKPFSHDDLLEILEQWANVGRKNRIFAQDGVIDESRDDRPVFLSYCNADLRTANLVRRNLEFRNISVWYAYDTVEPGDEWQERVRQGLKQANVFVPLITEGFSNSSGGIAELANVLRSFKPQIGRSRWIMPILYNYSTKDATDETIRRCFDYQHVTMTDKKLVDGFTALLVRIQQVLKKIKTG
jgi:CheY-like chemotaxis protein